MSTDLNQILTVNNVAKAIKENQDDIIKVIPEIKYMIGFDHKHPHHHLDVWEHTLEVIRNLDTQDLELNMAGLLHDIGKPFSYQDEEIRHFHGHPEVSYDMTIKILKRLDYDKDFIDSVAYLVKKHDTIIDVDNLDNSYEMIEKLLKLQYADAKSHHPDKVDKRIKFLDSINNQINKKFESER